MRAFDKTKNNPYSTPMICNEPIVVNIYEENPYFAPNKRYLYSIGFNTKEELEDWRLKNKIKVNNG